jgi:ATP-binding protein involved in chromosome partitioning
MFKTKKGDRVMLKKIAVPTVNGDLCLHFGHCEKFVVYEVDLENKKIISENFLTPPPHEPGVIPRFMKEQNVDIIIAGGMGVRAQELFVSYGIQVVIGAMSKDVKQIVDDFLNGKLETGDNACSH